ncbi:RNA polymerase sigma-54 factor [Spirochaetia bacterium]|nr:RNA polymerase sigma-54 factor [Spirochaetia bacterium]
MQQVQRVGFSQEQRLSQVLNTQMLQAIKIMELPVIDLRERISQEIEKNPALELISDRSTVSFESMNENKEKKPEKEYFETSSDSGFIQGGRAYSGSDKQLFMESTIARDETLQEHLLWQLHMARLSENERAAGEFIIQNIDSDGFNITPIKELFNKNKYPENTLQHILGFVQALDPIGCCVNNYIESLNVQAKIKYPDDALLLEKLIPHMHEIEKRKFDAVLSILNIDKEELNILYEELKDLNPFPGRQFKSGGGGEPRFVIPDIQVVRKKEVVDAEQKGIIKKDFDDSSEANLNSEDEDEFSIILNNEEIPVLGIHPFFLNDNSDKQQAHKLKTEEKDFMQDALKEARWFLECINRRNHTLLRVTRAILELQKKFFLYGPKYLSPLGLKDIATELKLSEATISRCANGKYVETEWGVFSLRYFFTNSISAPGIKNRTGESDTHSQAAVKEIIREIISEHRSGGDAAAQKKLSDNDICSLLEKRGIRIARRTVAKYRGQLDIGSSYDR